MQKISTVAIAGAGTMGAGIAQITAQAGYRTILFDLNQDILIKAKANIEQAYSMLVSKGKLSRHQADAAQAQLLYTSQVTDVVADLVIEAIIEKLAVKQELFLTLASINSTQTILASNTSSIPITQIAAGIPHPERVLGIHFFNPAPIMKLVEIISGVETNGDLALGCKQWIESLGKTCVMAADAPGFIVNRVARHFYVESLKLAEEQVADIETIDQLMQASGFKMGPFQLMDLIGVDTNFSVTSSMYQLFHQDPKFRPSRLQQQKVDAGHHGRKTGKGFYDYA